MRYAEVMRLRSWDFVRLVGVSVDVYQIMVEAVGQQSCCFGRPPQLTLPVHDFALFKASRSSFEASAQLRADSGYQGLTKWHPNSNTHYKSSKLKPLCLIKSNFLELLLKT